MSNGYSAQICVWLTWMVYAYESTLKIDRKCSGSRRAYIHQRRSLVPAKGGEVKTRLVLGNFKLAFTGIFVKEVE